MSLYPVLCSIYQSMVLLLKLCNLFPPIVFLLLIPLKRSFLSNLIRLSRSSIFTFPLLIIIRILQIHIFLFKARPKRCTLQLPYTFSELIQALFIVTLDCLFPITTSGTLLPQLEIACLIFSLNHPILLKKLFLNGTGTDCEQVRWC